MNTPMNTAERSAVIECLIPRPPLDIARLRNAFSTMVANQWAMYLPTVTTPSQPGASLGQSVKVRFIAEMYARACYSMLLLSAGNPSLVCLPLRVTPKLPLSRGLAIRLGGALLSNLSALAPPAVHRQILLISALMGTLDVVLDESASLGEAAVLRIASLVSTRAPAPLAPAEQSIATLTGMIRRNESSWQSTYWEGVIEPAVHEYCLAEALAVAGASDPKGMGHRWAGIDSAIKAMWYVAGSFMGLEGNLSRFEQSEWNREQQWMADTSLLMQMIDDWMDQDEDKGVRLTRISHSN